MVTLTKLERFFNIAKRRQEAGVRVVVITKEADEERFGAIVRCSGGILRRKNRELEELFPVLQKSFDIFKGLRKNTAGEIGMATSDLGFVQDYFKAVTLSDMRRYLSSSA